MNNNVGSSDHWNLVLFLEIPDANSPGDAWMFWSWLCCWLWVSALVLLVLTGGLPEAWHVSFGCGLRIWLLDCSLWPHGTNYSTPFRESNCRTSKIANHLLKLPCPCYISHAAKDHVILKQCALTSKLLVVLQVGETGRTVGVEHIEELVDRSIDAIKQTPAGYLMDKGHLVVHCTDLPSHLVTYRIASLS